MKTIIIILSALLFSLNVNAQLPIDEETGKVVFTDVVQLEGMTKKQIYDKAKLWIVSTLKSGDNMVELGGTNSDQIIGTGNLALENIVMGGYFKVVDPSLNFKFIIFIKDGRLKYKVSNFTFNYKYFYSVTFKNEYNTGLVVLKCPEELKNKKYIATFEASVTNDVNSKIELLIKDLITHMKKEEDNDW